MTLAPPSPASWYEAAGLGAIEMDGGEMEMGWGAGVLLLADGEAAVVTEGGPEDSGDGGAGEAGEAERELAIAGLSQLDDGFLDTLSSVNLACSPSLPPPPAPPPTPAIPTGRATAPSPLVSADNTKLAFVNTRCCGFAAPTPPAPCAVNVLRMDESLSPRGRSWRSRRVGGGPSAAAPGRAGVCWNESVTALVAREVVKLVGKPARRRPNGLALGMRRGAGAGAGIGAG